MLNGLFSTLWDKSLADQHRLACCKESCDERIEVPVYAIIPVPLPLLLAVLIALVGDEGWGNLRAKIVAFSIGGILDQLLLPSEQQP